MSRAAASFAAVLLAALLPTAALLGPSALAQVPARLTPTCPPEKAGSVLTCQDTGRAGWSVESQARYVTFTIPPFTALPGTIGQVNLTTPLTSGKTWPYTVPLDGFLTSVRATCNNYAWGGNLVFDVLRGTTSVLVAPLTLPSYTNFAITTGIADNTVSQGDLLTVRLTTFASGAANCNVQMAFSLPALTVAAAPPAPSTLTAARLTCMIAPTLSALAIDVQAAPTWGGVPTSVLTAPLELAAGALSVESTAIAVPELLAGQPLSLALSARDTGQTAANCSVQLTAIQ